MFTSFSSSRIEVVDFATDTVNALGSLEQRDADHARGHWRPDWEIVFFEIFVTRSFYLG
jgi:hypothetical protein